MRDFSWKYFINTGDVDAYLLYKQINEQDEEELEQEDIPEEDGVIN
ncbi:YqzL family protein [Chengkuizengella axinellae]|uniref:YqzL family protein n=1 Tax=Chengkuizengella axinellae TaxID=3064388 RepID=A0ABT9IUQ7_9BACL|nr:YqzL family protein [Chengkuizengella sp. 2205SS18-9]MDP5273101.1 YqzL family protein [Chengkuizengella sp. 2205SS18-9]